MDRSPGYEKYLKIMAQKSEFTIGLHRIDDFCEKPRALIIWWKFVIKIFFRLYPFYFAVSFPSRRKLAEFALEGDLATIWLDYPVMIGRP